MGKHYLKLNDTQPILEVALKNPDGTAYDLTGSTARKLRIFLADGTTKLDRDMTIFGVATDGVLRYAWLATDWNAGNLVASPTDPPSAGVRDHYMEYEVTDSGGGIITFPNDGYDTLHITADVA